MKSLFYIVVLYFISSLRTRHRGSMSKTHTSTTRLVGVGRYRRPRANRVYSSARMSASPDSAVETLIRSSTSAP